MKRIASFLLLFTIFLTLFYNVLGYHLIFSFQEEQNWVSSMEKIPDSEFKVIQLNASLYSFMEDTDFEYVNENVTIKNKTYHIFKKRIHNNILSLFYLQNSHSDANDIKIKEIVDSQLFNTTSEDKNPTKKLFKSFFKDYIVSDNISIVFTNKKQFANASFKTIAAATSQSGYFTLPYSPPEKA